MSTRNVFALLAALGLCLGQAALLHAADSVYRTVDDEGNVVFTDKPPSNATEVTPTELNTFSSSDALAEAPDPGFIAPTETSSDEEEPAAYQYLAVTIITPSDDETVRNNAGNLNIQGQITPGLHRDHEAVLMMDGRPTGESSPTLTFELTNVDRGTHTLSIAVLDDSGRTLIMSDPVTVHLQRVSLLQRRASN